MAAQKVARKDLRSLHQDLMNWSAVLQQNELASDSTEDQNVFLMSIHESIAKCTEQYRPLSMSFQQWQTEQNMLDSKKVGAENRRSSIHKMIMLLAFQIECASKLELESKTGSECGMHIGEDLNQHEIDELIFSPTKEKSSNEDLDDPFSAKLDDILDTEEQNPAFTYPDTPPNSPLVGKIVDNDTKFAFKSSNQKIHAHSFSSEIESTASTVSEEVNYSETDDKFPAPPANTISNKDAYVLQNNKATNSHSVRSQRTTTENQYTYSDIDLNQKETNAFTTAEKICIANELKVASITELPFKEPAVQNNGCISDVSEQPTETKTSKAFDETGVDDAVNNNFDISLNLSHSYSEESISESENVDAESAVTSKSTSENTNAPEIRCYSSDKGKEHLSKSRRQEGSIYQQYQFEEVKGDIKEFEYPNEDAMPVVNDGQRKLEVDNFPIVLDSDEFSCDNGSQENSFTDQQKEKDNCVHSENDVFIHSTNNGFIHLESSDCIRPEEKSLGEEPKLQHFAPGSANNETVGASHSDGSSRDKEEEVAASHEVILTEEVSASPKVVNVEEVVASREILQKGYVSSEVTASPEVVVEEVTASPKVIVVDEVALNSTIVFGPAKTVLIEENTPDHNFLPCREILVQEVQYEPKASIEAYIEENKRRKTDSLRNNEDDVFTSDEEICEDAQLARGPRIEIPVETAVVEKVSLTPLSSPLSKVCSELSVFSQLPENSRGVVIEDGRSEPTDLYRLPSDSQAVKMLSYSALQDGPSKHDDGENDKFTLQDALSSEFSDGEHEKYERKSSSSSCGAGSYTVNFTELSTSDDRALELEPHASENPVATETETRKSEKLKDAEPHKSEVFVVAKTHKSEKPTQPANQSVNPSPVINVKKSDLKNSISGISSRSQQENFAERSKLLFEQKKKLFESSHSTVIHEKKTVVHSGRVRSAMEKLFEEKKSPEKRSVSVSSVRSHRVVCPNPGMPSPTYAPCDQKPLPVFAARPFSVSSSKRSHVAVAAPTKKPLVSSTSVEEKIKKFQPSSPPPKLIQPKPKHSVKRVKIAGKQVDAGKSSVATQSHFSKSNPLPSELPPIPPLPDVALIDEDIDKETYFSASSKCNVEVDAAPPRPALPDFKKLNESFGAEDM